MIATLFVWESLDALRAFVYQGDHGGAFRRRAEWFEARPGQPNAVLWWAHGPTANAFTFSKPFPAPGV